MIAYKKFDRNFSLVGKIALITGGANGIGNAIATLFAEKGADILLFDIAENGEEAARVLRDSYGVQASFLHVDVSKKTLINDAVAQVIQNSEHIDILVNNAGVVHLDGAELLSEQAWDQTMAINLKAVFLMSQAVGRHMISNRGGKIVNMASQAGIVALDNHIAYCASKAAVISMTKVLANEWAQFGINVNAISPTVVLTELGEKAWAGKVGEDMKKMIPNGRFAYPDEIAALALFLACDASQMINGENVVIDGAYTIR